ncbi:MAG: metallophosphoesterase family protein [Rhodobiaceae bacterium]|nr:metallophosphoesterase family protein [Rhodobiaceae bacterium]MCC0053221.1 metallophosphoesterase family protein [Rhodobiaceae bacterium]
MTDAGPAIRDLGRIDEPVLVFGGVYSNLEAFRALVEQAHRLAIPPQHMVHTGDIIAYGADPQACARMLRDLACPAIKGNVEQQLADGALDCGCGFDEGTGCDLLSARWFDFARRRVDPDLCAWMGRLADHMYFEMAGVSVRVVHGAPRQANRFLYGPEPDQDFAGELDAVAEDFVIAGHSGFPFFRRFGPRGWLNTGALGIPGDDGTPRTWYAVLTPEKTGIRINLHALAYDHASAVAKLRAAGLPEPYAIALEGGPAPNRDTLPAPLQARAGQQLAFEPIMLEAAKVEAG